MSNEQMLRLSEDLIHHSDVTRLVEEAKRASLRFKARCVHAGAGNDASGELWHPDQDLSTHNSLAADKLNATFFPSLQKLYETIRRDVAKYGCTGPWTETCTYHFPFYVDLDMKLPVAKISVQSVAVLCRIMLRRVHRFYETARALEHVHCIICMKTDRHPNTLGCGEKEVDGKGNVLYKHGVHVVFPDIVVDYNQAQRIRLGILSALDGTEWDEHFGFRDLCWPDIFDNAVYNREKNRSGLRMLYAVKVKDCAACKRSRGSYCDFCVRKGSRRFVVVPTFYVIAARLRGELEVQVEREILRRDLVVERLHAVSLRRGDEVGPTHGFQVYDGCPEVVDAKPKGAAATNKFVTKAKCDDYDGRDLDPRAKSILLGVLRSFSPKYASDVTLGDVKVFSGSKMWVNFKGENARYCPNKGSEHNTSRVWMYIVKRHDHADAHLKCHCKKERLPPGGRGPCKTYLSVKRTISRSDAILLGFDFSSGASSSAPPSAPAGSKEAMVQMIRNRMIQKP